MTKNENTVPDVNLQDPMLLKIVGMIPKVQKHIEATRALFDLILEYKRDDHPHFFSRTHYTEGEREELRLFQKKHLLRRIQEEAVKAGFTEFDIKV